MRLRSIGGMNLGQSWVDFSPLAKKRLRKKNLFYADIFSNFDLENLYSNDCRNDKTEPRPNIS